VCKPRGTGITTKSHHTKRLERKCFINFFWVEHVSYGFSNLDRWSAARFSAPFVSRTWKSNSWSSKTHRSNLALASFLAKRLDTIFEEHERGILLEKMSHRSRDFVEILNESPVKTSVTEETSNTLDGRGMRKFSNDIDFGSVYLNPIFGNLMAEDNALFDHKVAFLPV
nr:hypothetical protein [Tanacetum cinerariifolium]